ncbi:MAG: ribose 5-phosphate isomerase B [Cytophagales bacterium]|nr:ribose 5-phosphate isomerase B [Cytophagales bacterium]
MTIKIAVGGDHVGFYLKEKLIKKLQAQEFVIKDFGTFSDTSVDYPDFVHPVAEAVRKNEYNYGILACGSGNGVAMAANKHHDIRAALCWNEELATLARQHNNANILCLPARFVAYKLAEKMVAIFLNTTFLGERHTKRVAKINC